MKRIITILCLAVVAAWAMAVTQEHAPRVKYPGKKSYSFRITLANKKGCGYSVEKPRQFLTAKAIERRRKQGIALDSTDLPVSRNYVRTILATTDEIALVGTSKWNNTVVVNITDTSIVRDIS